MHIHGLIRDRKAQSVPLLAFDDFDTDDGKENNKPEDSVYLYFWPDA
jgi:hypothetical protein